MGGSVGAAVKKTVKKATSSAEGALKAASWVYNPYGNLMKEGSKAAGVKADVAFDPLGETSAQAGETFVDKPKAMKEQAKRFAAETDAANKRFQRDIENKRKQSDAEAKASKDLVKARKRQDAKRKKGRASTIATSADPGSAGSVGTGSGSTLGGQSGGRKSLLGL